MTLYVSAVAKVPTKKEDLRKKYHYPPVPGNMGWNWVAEDIPGMKVRTVNCLFVLHSRLKEDVRQSSCDRYINLPGPRELFRRDTAYLARGN